MASSHCLIAVVLVLCYATTTFAQENSTVQQANSTFIGCKINRKSLNGISNSTGCSLHIDNSIIEEVLKLQHKPTTNIVRLKVSVISENGTRTRCFPVMEWSWANYIGRTIISLVKQAMLFTSPVFTEILEVGTEKVDIQVMEKTDGCLPPGNEGSDRVFDFLLHQLAQSKDTQLYELCRAHVDKSAHDGTYNCCRIIRGGSLSICDDYSSIVLTSALSAVIVIFLISSFMVLPFVHEHIINYPKIKSYKMSDSPMSLISVASKIFCEGRGPAKSFFRRLAFTGLAYMVYFFNFFGLLWFKWLFRVWAILFVLHEQCGLQMIIAMFECVHWIYKKCKKATCTKRENMTTRMKCMKTTCTSTPWDKSIIDLFTHPLSLPYYCDCDCDKCCDTSYCRYLVKFCKEMFICFIKFVYFLALVVVCLLKFVVFDTIISLSWPCCPAESWQKIVLVLMRVPTLANIVLVAGMISMYAVAIVVGLTLNGEYFSPFVVPVVTLITYLWKNWTSSVEGKCLQLKTSIIEICKKKALAFPLENSENTIAKNNNKPGDLKRFCDALFSCLPDNSRNPRTWECCCCNLCSCTPLQDPDLSFECKSLIPCMRPKLKDDKEDEELKIESDKHGETMISKTLYEKVVKEILPLDQLLFYFFRKVIFIFLYAFVMFAVMTLARDSGVSNSVQAINGIAGALIPFIFDILFAEHHSPQKVCNDLAMKERLEHMLKINKREGSKIFVELINVNISENQTEQGNDNEQENNEQHETDIGTDIEMGNTT